MSPCNRWSAPTHLTCKAMHPPIAPGGCLHHPPHLGAVHLRDECRSVCVCPRRRVEVPSVALLTITRAPGMTQNQTLPGTFVSCLGCQLGPTIHSWMAPVR